eukprot:1325858-Pyramimonas_sp.AAC.1
MFCRGILDSTPHMTWKIAMGNTALTEVGDILDSMHYSRPDGLQVPAQCRLLQNWRCGAATAEP